MLYVRTRKEQEDYISLTDIVRYKNPNEPIDIIKNWLRSRTTIEFIGLWAQLHNQDFKAVEFDRFMYGLPGRIYDHTSAVCRANYFCSCRHLLVSRRPERISR
ncbi:KilA-N domain-containing protein [Geotalea uraniireducens]|nr:KilA-N domain-containing protein [Geotalea uraniireducens]